MGQYGRMTFIVNFITGGYTIVKFNTWTEFAQWAQDCERKVGKVSVDYDDE